jgi:hypothetical protein
VAAAAACKGERAVVVFGSICGFRGENRSAVEVWGDSSRPAKPRGRLAAAVRGGGRRRTVRGTKTMLRVRLDGRGVALEHDVCVRRIK